jgi:transposase-like protein
LHKPEFKAKVALTAIRGEMTMAEMVKKFEVQAPQITQWKKQLMSSAGAAFAKVISWPTISEINSLCLGSK